MVDNCLCDQKKLELLKQQEVTIDNGDFYLSSGDGGTCDLCHLHIEIELFAIQACVCGVPYYCGLHNTDLHRIKELAVKTQWYPCNKKCRKSKTTPYLRVW